MKQKMNKRGESEVDFAKSFLVGLVVLVLVGILGYIIVTQIGNSAQTAIPSVGGSAVNESSTSGGLNSTLNITVGQSGLGGFTLVSITSIVNATGGNGTVLPGANYSFTPAGVIFKVGTTNFNTSSINLTYTYTINSNAENQVTGAVNNFSSGLGQFFAQFPVILVLLGIVLVTIVAAIAIKIFSGRSMMGGSSGGAFEAG